MEIVSLALVSHSRSDTPDRDERRERRAGYRRRREDVAPTGAAELGGPSAAFLIQVASQMRPAYLETVSGYAPRAWRCGVCADQKA